MRVAAESHLADALAEWGRHERHGRFITSPVAASTLSDIDVALIMRPQFISRILAGEPVHTVRVDLEPDDVGSLARADGMPLEEWATASTIDDSDSACYIRDLIRTDDPLSGSLIIAAQSDGADGLIGPALLFDT